jgi:hypothetical protein
MALGDGIRRNIASVEPLERTLLRDAFVELNHRYYLGTRGDTPTGGVSWWFKQDEIHQATHVHQGPEFVPWHRVIVNRLEELLRQVNPLLSLHYWDWTQDPTNIPNANLGAGVTGTLDLFTPDFMGYGGTTSAPIGQPWLTAGFYVPGANPHRDGTGGNAADPPQAVNRSVVGSPASINEDNGILGAGDYALMRTRMEVTHDNMHGYVRMGNQHISFRDPFVFLLHSNVDRLFARWQTDPAHPGRLEPTTVYGSESNLDVLVGATIQNVNHNVEPWSTGHSTDQFGVAHDTRPWHAPESLGSPFTYKHQSVVFPPCYDTNHAGAVPFVEVVNPGTPPVVNFNSVPSGDTAMRAAIFRVYGCANTTVRVKAGFGPTAPFSVLQPPSGSVTVGHGSNLFAEARIWLGFTAGAANVPVPDGSVTFECPENGDEFQFVLKANAIDRPTVAVMLALDQSGSMADPAGTSGARRIEVLKSAANVFMEVIPKDNGVGFIRFDHNSYAPNDPNFPGLAMTKMLSDGPHAQRQAAITAVTGVATNPLGSTSVGDGVDRARQVLNAIPLTDFTQHALIVLTDGLENDPLWISDVAGSIDAQTFAIGLGNEHQVNTKALRDLADGTRGFLYLTGVLTPSTDDYFRLRKFFLQILAGVTNTDVITDPNGYLAPGSTVRIPFYVCEADIECTALLLTDFNVVDLALETPDGTLITEAAAGGLGITYVTGDQSKHLRYTVPVPIAAGQREGVWYAVLSLDKPGFKKLLSGFGDRERQSSAFVSLSTHGPRYSFLAQTYSNLRMRVRTEQSGFEPGADVTFMAELTEYDVPVENRAAVWAEITMPFGGTLNLNMDETGPGFFEGRFATTKSGIYHARILAKGSTLRGNSFTREAIATAAVWRGGDKPYEAPRDAHQRDWADLFGRLLSDRYIRGDVRKRLIKDGLDLDGLRDALVERSERRPREGRGEPDRGDERPRRRKSS